MRMSRSTRFAIIYRLENEIAAHKETIEVLKKYSRSENEFSELVRITNEEIELKQTLLNELRKEEKEDEQAQNQN